MNTRAARRYAKALLSLALEKKQEDFIFQDMKDIALNISESEDLQILLGNPLIQNKEKKQTLDRIFTKTTALTKKSIELLTSNKRIALLQEVANQYIILYNEVKEVVKAVVITAIPIDDAMREKVLKKARELADNKNIHLENIIDKTVLGGFILRVGDMQIDASITHKLKKLRREFKENIHFYNN